MSEIERSIDLEAPAEVVWNAITDDGLLSEWLAAEVELEPWEGGALRCRHEDGEERAGAVREVAEGELIAFEWEREDSAPSRVELRIDQLEQGCRLTVVESGLRRQDGPRASAGWSKRLESLRLALASLAYA